MADKIPIRDILDRQIRWWGEDQTAEQVLADFRKNGTPHKIIYLYVASSTKKLSGVVPIRRLIAARPEQKLKELVIPELVSLHEGVTAREAKKAFAKHQFLSLPVVNQHGELVGVLDIEAFAGDLGTFDDRADFDDVYELLGLKLLDEKSGILQIMKARFPWLISTFISGFLSVLLVSHYNQTLQTAIVLAFFMTMVLGLNESLAMQAAGISIQRLHNRDSLPGGFLKNFFKEIKTGFIFGLVCAALISLFSWLWHHSTKEATMLFLSIVLTNMTSNLLGTFIPSILHKFHLDAKVAAAPLVLGFTDLVTLLVYLSLGQYFFTNHDVILAGTELFFPIFA